MANKKEDRSLEGWAALILGPSLKPDSACRAELVREYELLHVDFVSLSKTLTYYLTYGKNLELIFGPGHIDSLIYLLTSIMNHLVVIRALRMILGKEKDAR